MVYVCNVIDMNIEYLLIFTQNIFCKVPELDPSLSSEHLLRAETCEHFAANYRLLQVFAAVGVLHEQVF